MLQDRLRYALSGRWTATNRDPTSSPSSLRGAMDQDRNALIAEFCGITGASAQDVCLLDLLLLNLF